MKERSKSQFSAEFRQECVSLVTEQKYSMVAAARAMNIGQSTLSRWVSASKKENSYLKPTIAITPEQLKIKELEKKLKRIEMENSILKKATALLMSDSMHNLS